MVWIAGHLGCVYTPGVLYRVKVRGYIGQDIQVWWASPGRNRLANLFILLEINSQLT